MNVVWSPSPNWNQRDARYPLRGDVSHRIVGTAPSALSLFSRPGTASSHFVIGHTQVGEPCPRCGPITGAKGELVIWQCVDLALMAWTNGDVRNPTWPGYQAGVNPNLTTITTEHEDMGAAGRHIVTNHIWEASMELKRLLRSRDLAAIRATGIRVGHAAFSADALVARMAALPIDGVTYIDHHQIAGPNKPWCWRNFDGDSGFPDRLADLLAYLNREKDMTFQWAPRLATAIAGTSIHAGPSMESFTGSRFRAGPVAVLGDVDERWLAAVVAETVQYAQRAGFKDNSGQADAVIYQRIADAFNGTPASADCSEQDAALAAANAALDSANTRTATVKTAGAGALRKAKAVEEAHAAALEASAVSIEKL